MSAVSFQGASYTYPGAEAPALADVTLEIQPGELCLLAGLSGHGKSTFLRAACGLAPHFHGGTFAGRVIVAGIDTREHSPAEIGRHVGVLFQDPECQLVMGSVRSELALAIESRGQSATAVARGVEEVALALGIDHLLDRPTHGLSGGEKQRVALGAALAGRPSIVLLDEPTSQLDPVAGDELLSLLRRLNQEWDTTIVLSEHRLERCLASADRVIALQSGQVVHDGPPAAFLRWAGSAAPPLQTPAARLLELANVDSMPVGVKQARAALRRARLLPDPNASRSSEPLADGGCAKGRAGVLSRLRSGGRDDRQPALDLRKVWFEIRHGPAILRGVELTLMPGETVVLMGRNGAGKSTLLRHAAGLLSPTRGQVRCSGRIALMLQNPGDYFLRERVSEELSGEALARAGLTALGDRHPRDLSGGERQRLALSIVADQGEPPAVLALDEPTRGMDRESKSALAQELRRRAQAGLAVIVTTHDPEFAAACAERAVLLADGRVIADGPASELLSGGWYFATETARILGGAGGALLPEQGARLLSQEALC